MVTFTGEMAALSAAFLWAMTSTVYGRFGVNIAPLVLNLIKGTIAIASIGLTILLFGGETAPLPLKPMLLLLLSGALGIGLGDTAFFKTLNQLGARRTLLLETLAPPLTALLAAIFLNEQLTPLSWGGILITIAGVAWVITERSPDVTISPQNLKRGAMWGMLAAIAQSSGAVLSRAALLNTPVSPLWSSLLRIAAGVAIVIILLAIQGASVLKVQWSWRLIAILAIAAFFGTHIAIWLQQTSLKYAPAGIAQTLSATSPLFVLPLAAIMGDRVSLRAIIGVCIAIAGIGVLCR